MSDLDLVILRHASQRPSRWRPMRWLRWAYEHDQLLAVREHLESIHRHPCIGEPGDHQFVFRDDPAFRSWTAPEAAHQPYIKAYDNPLSVNIRPVPVRKPDHDCGRDHPGADVYHPPEGDA